MNTKSSSKSQSGIWISSSKPDSLRWKTISCMFGAVCDMGPAYTPTTSVVQDCEFSSQLRTSQDKSVRQGLRVVFRGRIKAKGPTASQQVEPFSVRMWTHPEAGNTETRYQNPAASTTPERLSHDRSWGSFRLPADTKPIATPNPGADLPPVNLARDARKGLHQQVMFAGREDLVPDDLKITGKGRFYDRRI